MLIPSYVHILTLQKPHIPAGFNMCLVISKCVTAVKVSNFSGQYLRNHWTLDIGVLGYIGIVWPKEHPPEVLHIPPGTPCIYSPNHEQSDVCTAVNITAVLSHPKCWYLVLSFCSTMGRGRGGGTVILHGHLEPEEHHLKRIPFKWGISAARNAVNMASLGWAWCTDCILEININWCKNFIKVCFLTYKQRN